MSWNSMWNNNMSLKSLQQIIELLIYKEILWEVICNNMWYINNINVVLFLLHFRTQLLNLPWGFDTDDNTSTHHHNLGTMYMTLKNIKYVKHWIANFGLYFYCVLNISIPSSTKTIVTLSMRRNLWYVTNNST